MSRKKLDPADLISPEELLANAYKLLKSKDPSVMRAVILESMTTLEIIVYEKIFKILRNMLDPLLVKWLEDKTEMDFDARLGYLTPMALEKDVKAHKEGDLWRRYQNARNVRNNVVHQGKKVSIEEAEEIYQTILDWLLYLESNAALKVELLKLRNYIETNKFEIKSEFEIEKLIRDFFNNSKAASIQKEYLLNETFRADFLLKFGKEIIIGEIKFLQNSDFSEADLRKIILQSQKYLQETKIEKIVFILCIKGDLPLFLHRIIKYENGRIIILGIKIK